MTWAGVRATYNVNHIASITRQTSYQASDNSPIVPGRCREMGRASNQSHGNKKECNCVKRPGSSEYIGSLVADLESTHLFFKLLRLC